MKILFVCTGNIFRSMSAEFSLRDYLKNNLIDNIIVSSAGTDPNQGGVDPNVSKTLLELGIDVSNHSPRKLTKEILEENDIIVAMSTDHKEFIETNFEITPFLFNEIAFDKMTPLLDNSEALIDWDTNKQAFDEYNSMMVKHIYATIPIFAEKLFTKIYPKS